MKRYLRIQCLAAVAAFALALPVVTAQDAESDKRTQRAERAERARQQRAAEQQERIAAGRQDAKRGPQDGLRKLQRAMSRMEISERQRTAIDALFEGHFAEYGGREVPADQKEFLKKMREAYAAEDMERVDEIRRQRAELESGRAEQMREATTKLLGEIEEQLETAQRDQFHQLVERFRVNQQRRTTSPRMKAVMRAVYNRDVDLSEEQREKIKSLQRDAHKAARAKRLDKEERAEQDEKLISEILAVLTSEQQETVEASIKKLEERMSAAERRRSRERGDDK